MPVLDKTLILDTLHIMKGVSNIADKHSYLKMGYSAYNVIDQFENNIVFGNTTNDITVNGKSIIINSRSTILNRSATGFGIANEIGIVSIENNSSSVDCIVIKSKHNSADKGDILIGKVTPDGDSYIRLGHQKINSTDTVYGIIINAVNTLYMRSINDFRLITNGVGNIETEDNLNITVGKVCNIETESGFNITSGGTSSIEVEGGDLNISATNIYIAGEVEVSKKVKLGVSGTITTGNKYAITGEVAYNYITNELKKYLPLSGGTMTGNIQMGSNAILFNGSSTQGIKHGTKKINDQSLTGLIIGDISENNNGSYNILGQDTYVKGFIEVGGVITSKSYIEIATSGSVASGNSRAVTGGVVYTALQSYLPLAGGTITGNLTVNGKIITKSYGTSAPSTSGAVAGQLYFQLI